MQHPELAAVLKEMGFNCTQKILCDSHPIVIAATAATAAGKAGQPSALPPSSANVTSSLLMGRIHVSSNYSAC